MAIDERWNQLGDASSLLKLDGLQPREYQLSIIHSIISHGNSLVVLPTGLGKTFIGAAIMAKALAQGKKAMILAPTKPLSEQHYNVLTKLLNIPESDILLLTGSLKKSDRVVLEKSAKIIIATPLTCLTLPETTSRS